MEGIEWFIKGEYIQIQTHRNRQRNISQLAQTKVKYIGLYVEQSEDVVAVAGCKYLKTINIYRSKENDFSSWSKVTADTISFKSCKFAELGNMARILALEDLNVLGCRNLERFTGDNSTIKRLIVDGSKKLDLRTLKTFTGVEVLIINSFTQELNLTEIGGLTSVKHIDFIVSEAGVLAYLRDEEGLWFAIKTVESWCSDHKQVV
ncbi:hypothetical protein [Paenibacillus faecis]|uniref:hypothetical protein n=1 Tax=Paenibacillus faecis TaxID=862114 RepID=UPI001BCC65C5|nr:hypothetical protein [Paenibacillus faecis]